MTDELDLLYTDLQTCPFQAGFIVYRAYTNEIISRDRARELCAELDYNSDWIDRVFPPEVVRTMSQQKSGAIFNQRLQKVIRSGESRPTLLKHLSITYNGLLLDSPKSEYDLEERLTRRIQVYVYDKAKGNGGQ